MKPRFDSLRCAAIACSFPLLAGCSVEDDGENSDVVCLGGKCDVPTDSSEEACKKRQAEAVNSSNRSFTPEGIRWACGDVEGVTANGHQRDDRGQEYCEYFAVVNVPTDDGEQALDFGRLLSAQQNATKLALCLQEDIDAGDVDESDCRAVLTEDQAFDFEDKASEVVGSCVFTSWHGDVSRPLEVCGDNDSETCLEESGPAAVRLDGDFLRMKGRFNVNGAASQLVSDCFDLQKDLETKDPDDLPDALKDPEPFFRGCMATAIGGAGVEWRRSDPAICAAVMRTVDCGCGAPGVENGRDLGKAVVPNPIDDEGELALRGFRLGTWDKPDGLPNGCRFADVGEDSDTVVLCDITGADVMASRQDPKEACRAIYANNVVVHIDLPTAALTCEPAPDKVEECGQFPWNLGDENAGVDPDPDPDPECGLHIAEVFYDAEGRDDDREWVKLYNSCDDDISLAGKSLGWGGSAYTTGGIDLDGTVAGKGCFIVGGVDSGDENGNPGLHQRADFSPDLQNSGTEADGVAVFDVLEADVTRETVPVDAVVYGVTNPSELLDRDGEIAQPHVGDAPAGGSIVRAGADGWLSSDISRAADCPDF